MKLDFGAGSGDGTASDESRGPEPGSGSDPAGENRNIRSTVSIKQLLAIAGILALLLVVACGGAATATPVPGAPAAAPTQSPSRSDAAIRVNLGGEPNNLDPQLASSLLEFSVLRQISQGLLGFDENLILMPMVAAVVPTVENGGITADGLTYTFKLRDGVTWSDGRPLTAGDFEYTFKRLLSPRWPDHTRISSPSSGAGKNT